MALSIITHIKTKVENALVVSDLEKITDKLWKFGKNIVKIKDSLEKNPVKKHKSKHKRSK